ncbi:MAG: double-strand break repair protein AddB, partial [Pseudomonadota bacterium]|nr:double-strand break repair protein AddB [Pseudomonadota bacterium]
MSGESGNGAGFGAAKVFFTPPGVDFSDALARGLRARLPETPAAMARVRLYLNARRTGRAVSEALEAGAPAAFLPRIALVGDLAEEALAAAIPQGKGRLRRTLALMRLTEAFLTANPGLADPASAPALALSLRGLLDELQAAGQGAEALRDLDLAQHAAHWTLTAEFLSILADAWPDYLAQEEHGAPDREARRRLAVAALVAGWEAAPPTDPVIVAGSTGSTPATAALMRAVAGLPAGALVLPGWDPAMPADVWAELTGAAPRPEHPHHHMARLLAELGLGPADPAPWDAACAAPPAPARLRLLTRALRPAPVTDAWRRELPEQAAEAGAAVEGLALLEAETPRDEAAAIAAALAAEAAAGGTPALITPDRVLARRVAAELARWGVAPDDSAGRPLGLTPPGILLGLAAGRLGRPMTAETLAALLRHPLTAKDRGPAREGRGTHNRLATALERDGLRGGPQEIDWDRLEAKLLARATLPDGFADWFAWVRATLTPLAAAPADLSAAVATHLRVAEALAAGPGGLAEGEDPAALPLWAE